MASMILGIFRGHDDAEDAINRFSSAGYHAKDISIIMRDKEKAEEVSTLTGVNVAGSATTGAATGGVIGGIAGLLMGIGAITIPGLGAVLIGGPIASALGLTGAAATTISGALTGALAGGFVGALMGLGIPEKEARDYEEEIKKGAILVAVPVSSGLESEAREIMETTGADKIRTIEMETKKHRDFGEEEYRTPAYYSEVKNRRNKKDILEDDDDLM